MLTFLLPFLFRIICQSSGQDWQNGKQAYCWLPLQSFRINFKDTLSHTSVDSLGVCLFKIFLQPVYSTMIVEKFWIYGVQVTRKYICKSKNWICSFLLIFIVSPHAFLSCSPQVDGNYLFLLNSVFSKSIFPQQKGRENILERKKWQKLNLRGYCSQVLINSNIFATCTFLVSV